MKPVLITHRPKEVRIWKNLKIVGSRTSVCRTFCEISFELKSGCRRCFQEVFLAACQKFAQLKNKDFFKAWIISIARNKCNDYFRKKATQYEIPIDEITESELSDGRHGVSIVATVRETLSLLGDKDKQILYLYFWKELPQAEIAKQLSIPVGTVKADFIRQKQNFKTKYPYNTEVSKGESTMKKVARIYSRIQN